MAMVLQQTLRGLCYDTGWCYAVFWKLKRQIRTVLTWEDGFYEQSKSPVTMRLNSASAALTSSGPSGGWGNFEDPIGLAVAKMSYHVYSVGEGIIGRVAFTNKHQWICNDNIVTADGIVTSKQNTGFQPEKYPAGWQAQFAAGIKTIAVIAVPQGVVQLGSTQSIPEDLNLVGHAKAVFGTLQNVSGVFLSDIVSESQRGTIHRPHAVVMSLPSVTSVGPPSTNSTATVPNLIRTRLVQAALDGVAATGLYATGSDCSEQSAVGSLPMLIASQQLYPQSQASPSTGVLGVQRSQLALQPSFSYKPGCQPFVQPSLQANKLLSTQTGATPVTSAEVGASPRTGIIGQFALSTEPSNVDTAADSRSVASSEHKSYLELTMKKPFQNISVTCREGPQLIRHIPAIAGSPVGFVDRVKDMPSQVDVQSLSDGFTCFVRNDFSSKESMALDSGTSTLSQESLQSSTVSSLGNNFSINRVSPDERQSLRQLHETGDFSIAYKDMSNSPLNLLSQPEAKKSNHDLWNAPEVHCDLQMSGLLQLTGRFENDNKPCFEKFGLDPTSSLFCEDRVEDLQPLKAACEKSEVCFNDFSGKPDGQIVFNSVLEDFDDFITSLMGEQDKQRDCFSMLGPSFAAGDELSEALFPISKRKLTHEAYIVDPAPKLNLEIPGNEVVCTSTTKAGDQVNRNGNINATFENMLQSAGLEAKPEPLLDAVVASVSNLKEISQTCYSNDLCKTGYLSMPSFPSEFMNKSCVSTSVEQSLASRHFITNSPVMISSKVKEEAASFCKDANVNELQGDMHVVEATSCTGIQHAQDDNVELGSQKAIPLPAAKQDDATKPGKKRARPGETGKPRPKDRQQIQDRVRELRDIIPNATKCSIDALLEKTIKYMNFLQTVTQDASKWKQSSKLQTNESDCVGPEHDGFHGASWAVELGGQKIGCPIIVENLSQPRQMLVEMLCEDKGIFLEIADSIRGLDLTILKGVMETRKGKIWARFVVEAIQDIHRVEVLCSLMQLLQPDSRSASTMNNAPCTWRTTH